MISIILGISLVIGFAVAYYSYTRDGFVTVVNTFIAAGIYATVVFYPVTLLTGGLVSDYSMGSRDGYITKMSRRGVFIKTWEGEMQIGTGNMAALQEPFSYSIPDESLRIKLDKAAQRGSRVRITYTQFLIPDYFMGESQYIVTDVKPLDLEVFE